MNANQRTYSDVSSEVNGLDIPTFYDLSNSRLIPPWQASIIQTGGLSGCIHRRELSYNNLLFMTLTARNDWSSTLPKNNNSFFYPGATLSFLFSDLLPRRSRMSSHWVRSDWPMVKRVMMPPSTAFILIMYRPTSITSSGISSFRLEEPMHSRWVIPWGTAALVPKFVQSMKLALI